MMKTWTRYLLFTLLFLLCASLLAAAENRQFPAQPGQTLVFELKGGGSVKVTGWSQSTFDISYEGDNEVEFIQEGNRLVVRSEQHSRNWSNRNRGNVFEVRAPHQTNIDLDSLGGSLSLHDLDGNFRGKTMGGALTLEDVSGVSSLTTMGGKIRVVNSELDGSVSTMGGEVLLKEVVGGLEGSSMGGLVVYQNVRRRDGSLVSPNGQLVPEADENSVLISTMGGRIELDDAPAGIDAKTMGGDIRIGRADRFARVTTMGGDIVLSDVAGWVEATTMGGDVEVHLRDTDGQQDVEISSMSGDVLLVVPASFSMELTARVHYSTPSENYRIESDIDLKQREEISNRQYYQDGGRPMKQRIGTASVRGGRNKVNISTVNGTIRIREGN